MARRNFKPLTLEPLPRRFTLGGREISCMVKRSRRARAWRLEFGARAGLVAVLPFRVPGDELDAIFVSRERWILRQLADAERRKEQAASRRLRAGGPFSFRGEEYIVHMNGNGGRPGVVTLGAGVLAVNAPPGDEAARRRAVTTWLKREAKKVITPLAAAAAPAMKVSYNKIYVRDQRTRWASCSAAGNLSFNYRLAMAPPDVLRYLVIHELAHLKTRRHGKRFRQLLEKHYAGFRAAEKWLRTNGDLLAF